MSDNSLSHVDGSGRLQMVDVSGKETTRRVAQAGCLVVTSVGLADFGETAIGLGVVQAARLAGIQAAKLTAHLIPLCHPLGLEDIQVNVHPHSRGAVVQSRVTTMARTGVEMEALTACAYCALSLLDSLGGRDPSTHVVDLAVLSKSGGKSDWGPGTDRP